MSSGQANSSRAQHAGSSLTDALLAEVVCALEEAEARPRETPDADARARAAGGDFASRIRIRAAARYDARGRAHALAAVGRRGRAGRAVGRRDANGERAVGAAAGGGPESRDAGALARGPV